MRASRGMGAINPSKMPGGKTMRRKDGDMFTDNGVQKRRKDGDQFTMYAEGGQVKSRVNEAGNYTNPGMRKALFDRIKAGGKGGDPGEWSARKAQMLAREYKAKGGGYKD